jgi:hypothetical protein
MQTETAQIGPLHVLYCTALYCAVLALYTVQLYSEGHVLRPCPCPCPLLLGALHPIQPRVHTHCTALYYTALYYTTLYCTVLYYTTLSCTALYYAAFLSTSPQLSSAIAHRPSPCTINLTLNYVPVTIALYQHTSSSLQAPRYQTVSRHTPYFLIPRFRRSSDKK